MKNVIFLFSILFFVNCSKYKLNIPYIVKDKNFFNILYSVCNKPFRHAGGYFERKGADGNIYIHNSDIMIYEFPNCSIYITDYKEELTSYNNRCIDKYCKIKEIYKGFYIAQNSGLGKKCDRMYKTFVYDEKFSFSFKLSVRSNETRYACRKKLLPGNIYYLGDNPSKVSVEIAKKLIDYFEKHLDLKD